MLLLVSLLLPLLLLMLLCVCVFARVCVNVFVGVCVRVCVCACVSARAYGRLSVGVCPRARVESDPTRSRPWVAAATTRRPSHWAMARDGLNSAHVPYQRVCKSTLWGICVAVMGEPTSKDQHGTSL